MTKKPKDGKLHEVAGGWMTERAGTPIPTFLKFTYVGFCLFALWYAWTYWAGETSHVTRGALVLEVNRVMEEPGSGFRYLFLAILAAFVIGLLAFAFRSGPEED